MTMFDSISRPKWQHKNPEIRRAAIDQLNDQKLFFEIVKTDPEITVQSHALNRITDPEILDKLVNTPQQDLSQILQKQASTQRLHQILPNPELLATITDDGILLKIASLTEDPALSSTVIAQIKNTAFLKDIAAQHSLAKVRLQAVQNISDIDVLRELMLDSKGSDKAVYRHCKTQLDAHHVKQQQELGTQEKIQLLIDEANKLATAADSPEYQGRYQLLEQQWSAVSNSANKSQIERFEKDMAICTKRLADDLEARERTEQKQTDLNTATQAFKIILDELEQISIDTSLSYKAGGSNQLTNILDSLNDRWQSASTVCPSDPELAASFKSSIEGWRLIAVTLQKLLDNAPDIDRHLLKAQQVDQLDYLSLEKKIGQLKKLLTTLSWPELHKIPPPPPLKQLKQALNDLGTHLISLDKDHKKYLASTEIALKNLNLALDQSHSKNADRALKKVRLAIKSLAPQHQQCFEKQLDGLSAHLNEIHDWQGFVIEPKKVVLCQNMTALITSEADPDDLAANIKSLQDEWKLLGTLPDAARDQALWKQFKAAADQAWQPCKAAFAEQAGLRRANFKSRMQLVGQLKDYEQQMTWPQSESDVFQIDPAPETTINAAAETKPGMPPSAKPDWQLVQKTLDAAREAFNNIQPLDHRGERKSQKAFRDICDQIYQHIKDEYGRNITRKKQLIGAAEQLANLDDLPDAINQAKRLQRDWKGIGITPMKLDRRLWKTFRAACDAVFTRRDEQQTQHKAAIDSLCKQAEAFLEQAKSLLSTGHDQQFQGLVKNIAELKSKVHALELPGNVKQRLSKDFEKIEHQARDIIDHARALKEQAGWDRLLEKMSACAIKNTAPEAANKLWEKTGDLPKGINTKALELFWQQGCTTGIDDQLRDACIGLELFGDIDSPAEDKEARMNYKMQRLVSQKGNRVPEQSLHSLINEFIELRPGDFWAQRFNATVSKIHT